MTAASLSSKPFSLVRDTGQPATFPGLEPVVERIGQGLRNQWSSLVGAPLALLPLERRQQRFEQWRAGLPAGQVALHCRLGHSRLAAIVLMPVTLVIGLVDLFYGGDGSAHAARAQLTAAERRLAERISQEAGRVFAAAWRPIAEIGMDGATVEAHPGRLTVFRADEPVRVQPFELAHPTLGSHAIEILFAVSQLSTFPALAVVPGDPEPGGIDPDARDRMIAALMQVCLPVRSVFVRPEMPIARLLALRPGDVIPISLPQHIPLTVAGRLFAHGTLGEADGRAAIRISRIEPHLLPPEQSGNFSHE